MLGELLGINASMREGDIVEHVATPIPDICKHCQYGLELGGMSSKARPRRKKVGAGYEIERRNRDGELPSISPTFAAAFEQHKSQPLVQLERF